jgi:hypothetical protein
MYHDSTNAGHLGDHEKEADGWLGSVITPYGWREHVNEKA